MTPLRLLAILTSVTIVFAIVLTIFLYDTVTDRIPSLEQLENPRQNLATQVFSADSVLLDHFFEEKRVSLTLEDIPPDFINALIATEDREFWNHWGIHLARIFNAALINLKSMRTAQGASTITQQLARNLFLDQAHTLDRKIREAFTAIEIEKNYSKKEILEMYCNTVLFGRGAYGIQVAAKVYFNKQPKELTTAECAMLVGLLKAPRHYDPAKNYDRAIQRRNLVLSLMKQQGYIDEDTYVESLMEPIIKQDDKAKSKPRFLAPHFVENIRQNINKDKSISGYDLYRDGLIIYTTLNSRIQEYANEAVKEHLNKYQKMFDKNWSWRKHRKLLKTILKESIRKRADYLAAGKTERKQIEKRLTKDKHFVDSVKKAVTIIQTGVVVLDPKTGAILAMVGASPKFMRENPYAKYSLNHVTQIRRQPGSSLKPFVYAEALEHGLTPEDSIECGPFSYTDSITGEVWSPRSGANCAPGQKVTLYDGLRRSINSVAARLITEVTNPYEVARLIRRAGVESKIIPVPALALGAGGEIKQIELASAFGSFAAGGYNFKPYYDTRIEDHFGNVLFQKKRPNRVSDVLPVNIAEDIIYMLQAVVDRGTAARIRYYFKGVDAAGKTGTTNDNADAWFTGFTPELVAGVWVGFDDQRINFDCIGRQGQGGRAAGPIWGILMNKIYADPKLPYKKKKFGLKRFADSTSSGIM